MSNYFVMIRKRNSQCCFYGKFLCIRSNRVAIRFHHFKYHYFGFEKNLQISCFTEILLSFFLKLFFHLRSRKISPLFIQEVRLASRFDSYLKPRKEKPVFVLLCFTFYCKVRKGRLFRFPSILWYKKHKFV